MHDACKFYTGIKPTPKESIVTNEESGRATVDIGEAAKRLGIGRNQAYEAARRGEVPVIKIGKRLLVPRAALERMLNGEAA
jgi:excisionase family DNA binding protein